MPPAVPRLGCSRRTALLGLLSCAAGVLTAHSGWAQGTSVPADLQARLLAKLGPYDRNFEQRAGKVVRVLLVVMPKDGKSKLAAAAMESALSKIDRIGTLPHEEKIVSYQDARRLSEQIEKENVSIVYITPSFDDEIDELRAHLTGTDVLSVSPVASYVRRGVVLGFELVSGKPKLALNLPQAKRQNIDFKASVLKLMKVYR